jgi:PAS domain S-box-containing protein
MLEQLIQSPEMADRRQRFARGQPLFREGERSQDLYVLVSGELEVLKGDKVVSHISEAGAVFGEMSFLLGGKRTATVRAAAPAECLVLPREMLEELTTGHPELAKEVTRLLAQRLDTATQVVYGLREFCDQLPEGVLIFDSQGQVINLNQAGSELLGRDLGGLRSELGLGVFEDPEAFQRLLERTREGEQVSDQVLAVNHPHQGRRWVSFSASLLSDHRREMQGMLVLGRDVTQSQTARRRLVRLLWWLLPLLALLAGYAAWTVWSPAPPAPAPQADQERRELKNQLAKDYFLLHSLLAPHFSAGRAATHPVLERFAAIQDAGSLPYRGVLLVGPDKRIFDALSLKPQAGLEELVGSTYGRVKLAPDKGSVHKVLTVYRLDPASGQGRQRVELAFECRREGERLGWVVFQMDMAKLADDGLAAGDLQGMSFRRPPPAKGGPEQG